VKRSTLRAAAACLFILAAFALVGAQTRAAETGARRDTSTPQPSAATAREDFDLNIAERHIRESDFHAATEVEAGGASGLNLRVGVMVRAEEIDVLLRNVQGHVRFRASLESILRLLDARRAARQTAAPTLPDTSP
jgi:ribosomal protein S28E/S33